jgi:predicted permease
MRYLSGVSTDLRLAFRSLARNPAFAVLAILTLAVGLGTNTAAFSAFDAVFSRDLPVREPRQLVTFHWLRTNDSMVAGYSGYGRIGPANTGIRTSFSPVTFDRFRRSSRTLSDVFAFADRLSLTIVADGATDTASGQVVSGNYYSALGVAAVRGRVLTDADDGPGAAAAAVMTYRFWQRRFGGDAGAIGKVVLVNNTPVVLVGVTPEGFDGTLATETSDLTLTLSHAGLAEDSGRPKPGWRWWLRIMGRLKADATLEQVEPDLHAMFEDTVRESWAMRPPSTPNPTRSQIPALRVMPGRQGPDGPRRDAMSDLAVPLGVGSAILVIGCANIANLVLIRGLRRRREVAIRMSLGATRSQLVRLLLAESVVISLAGGLLGIVIAQWGKDFLNWIPSPSTAIVAATIDHRALVFSAIVSILTAMLCGLAPALRATRRQPILDIQRRGWRRLAGQTMVVVQVTVCIILIAAAGLAVRTVRNLTHADAGFDTERLIVFRLSMSGNAATREPSPYDGLADALEATPGVKAATFSAMPLLARSEWTETIQPVDDSRTHEVYFQVVRSNFIRTIGLRLIGGRDFSPDDRSGTTPVAVINDRMARDVFGDASPLGRYFRMQTGSPRDVPIQVIGVVSDAKYARIQDDPVATLYRPAQQLPQAGVSFQVRTTSPPETVMAAIRDVVSQKLPGVAMVRLQTQRAQIDDTIAQPRTVASLAAIFGLVAVFLACLGIYGVVSYDVAQRTPELALRVVLGATPKQVVALVTRNVVLVVGLGSVAGIAIAASAVQVVRGLLYGVSPIDPLTFASAVAVMLLATFAAALPPAWRASRMHATEALKKE